MEDRNTTIDFLRGFAMLIMVAIDVTAFYLSQKTTYLVWDYTHFVVPIFVFCSAYLYFERKSDSPFNISYIINDIQTSSFGFRTDFKTRFSFWRPGPKLAGHTVFVFSFSFAFYSIFE